MVALLRFFLRLLILCDINDLACESPQHANHKKEQFRASVFPMARDTSISQQKCADPSCGSVVGRLASTPPATVVSRRVCVASSRNRRRAWRRPRGSGLNSCSLFYTTTNVSRRRRRAVGLPPRQRSWAAWEALGQLPSALHRAASAARSRHRGTRARHD